MTMRTLKIIDVTLRDGGHRVNFEFDDEHLRYLLSMLDDSGIDYVEVGYRNGTLPFDEHVGLAGFCANDYLAFCRQHLPHTRMAVMAYPQYIQPNDLKDLKAQGVDLLRVCVAKGNLDAGIKILELATQYQLDASINFTHTSTYSLEDLDSLVQKVSHVPLTAIYFADSNGSLTPEKIKAIYSRYVSRYTMPFGFHAHDNLGLAQSNAIAAIEQGVAFIDCSLAGFGKGIGNLRAEFFIAYLLGARMGTYQLDKLLTAANYIRHTFHTNTHAIALEEFMRAIENQP